MLKYCHSPKRPMFQMLFSRSQARMIPTLPAYIIYDLDHAKNDASTLIQKAKELQKPREAGECPGG